MCESVGCYIRQGQYPPSNPIDWIEHEHGLQLVLCERLEQIADRLPATTDPNLVHGLIQLLRGGMAPHDRMEEECLFPILCRRCVSDTLLAEICGQLEREHAQNRDLCWELAEELADFSQAGMPRNAEMLGYMLRGHFGSQRRHIEWENRILLPVARTRLLTSDLSELQKWMDDNGHRRFTDFLHLVISTPTRGLGPD